MTRNRTRALSQKRTYAQEADGQASSMVREINRAREEILRRALAEPDRAEDVLQEGARRLADLRNRPGIGYLLPGAPMNAFGTPANYLATLQSDYRRLQTTEPARRPHTYHA